jgi:hypothetical protein
MELMLDAEQVSSNQMAKLVASQEIKARETGVQRSFESKRLTAFTGKIDEFRLWNTLRNVEQNK